MNMQVKERIERKGLGNIQTHNKREISKKKLNNEFSYRHSVGLFGIWKKKIDIKTLQILKMLVLVTLIT